MPSNKIDSTSRALIFASLVFGFAVSLISCAHYDNESGTYSGSVLAPLPGHSHNIDVVEGTIAGIAIVYEMGRVSGNSKSPQIFGVCQIKTKRAVASDSDKERCAETYVNFRSLKDGHESKVWADSLGEFAFAMSPGVTYEVVAVNDRWNTRSQTIRVASPGRINLQIEIETVPTTQPVATKATSGEGSDRPESEQSDTPPIDFGLKPKNKKGR